MIPTHEPTVHGPCAPCSRARLCGRDVSGSAFRAPHSALSLSRALVESRCQRDRQKERALADASARRPYQERPRSARVLSSLLGLAVCLVVLLGACAQNNPRLGYVFPAGGQQGATFQATIGGQFLNGVTNAYLSGPGLRATVVEHARPLTPKEANDLREKLKELQEKRQAAFPNAPRRGGPAAVPNSTNALARAVWTPKDQQMIAEIREKLANFRKRQTNPTLAETVTLEVTIAGDAEPGQRELRLETPAGLSNPLVFCVGQLPEFCKQPPKEETANTEMNITLPALLNGQILPGAADRFRFKARQGQRLVLAASARDLIPYLPDAVPGWFQATLTLYDSSGHELAYNDDYRFDPDPVLYYEVPADGEYIVEIKDALYRGREDFVYRLAAGELPFVTSIFPLGGPTGAQSTVELRGWNLPAATLTLDEADRPPGIHLLPAGNNYRLFRAVPFALDTLPECREREPNNVPACAQRVIPPLIVNGRIDQPGDRDVFRFEGHAGSQIVAEVYARRLNSPLDSALELTDASGHSLAFNDDSDDKGAGLLTHQADSYLCAKLPANGAYYIHLWDAQHKGGPEYGYRLRVSPPRPDFELRVVPSSLNVRGGASTPFTVYALRKDGFTNEITLALKDPLEGFSLSGGRVPPNQDQVRLTITARPMTSRESFSLALEGRANIAGQSVVRTALPAEDLMQAFAYRHLVPTKELKVFVAERPGPRFPPRILGRTPVSIPAGGTARIQVALPPRASAGQVQLELSEPPDGIVLKEVVPSREGAELVFQADVAKLKPGLEGNLIIMAFAERPGARGTGNRPGNQRRLPLGCLPALPFEIVAP